MDKKYAFFFALTITLLIAINISLIKLQFSPEKEREQATIKRIIDGDTIELEDNRKIRLLNINTPEKNIPGSELATNYLKQYKNKTIELEITGTDKYSRILARLYTPEYLNLELVKKGMAVKFLVDKEEKSLFAEAEKQAINSSQGIWKKSFYYNCFQSKIYPKEEVVTITNNCNNLNIASWILKDESRKTFEFPEIELGAVKLHTKEGKNNATDLFWNSKAEVWNNDRDTLYLFDENWNIIHYDAYGY